MKKIVEMSIVAMGAWGLALVPSLSAFAATTHASLVTSKVIFQKAPITNPATLFYVVPIACAPCLDCSG